MCPRRQVSLLCSFFLHTFEGLALAISRHLQPQSAVPITCSGQLYPTSCQRRKADSCRLHNKALKTLIDWSWYITCPFLAWFAHVVDGICIGTLSRRRQSLLQFTIAKTPCWLTPNQDTKWAVELSPWVRSDYCIGLCSLLCMQL